MNAGVRLPPPYRLVAYDSVASTNQEAKRLADQGAEEGTLVWARQQTAGRGRHGRSWHSPIGNLYLSLILRPDCSPRSAAEVSFVAALAVGDAVGSALPPLAAVTHKWPNDVLVNQRKVAGILLESSSNADGIVDWLVVGIGVNVESFPDLGEYPATSLHFEGAAGATVESVLESLARHFMGWAAKWRDDGFAPIRATWQARAEGLGQAIVIRRDSGDVAGVFAGLDDDGAAIIEAEGGRVHVSAGDLYFAGTP